MAKKMSIVHAHAALTRVMVAESRAITSRQCRRSIGSRAIISVYVGQAVSKVDAIGKRGGPTSDDLRELEVIESRILKEAGIE